VDGGAVDASIGAWLADRPRPLRHRRVIAVDGKTLRGSAPQGHHVHLLAASTSVCARTAAVAWSIAASRWTGGVGWPLPRRVLPSTATAGGGRRGGGPLVVGGGGCWRASHAPMVESSGVGTDAGQHPAYGRLGGWPEGAGQGMTAHPERGQDRVGRIRGPLADRGQRPGAGQHRAGRHGQHHAQWVPSAAPLSGVGELSEVLEQAAVLVAHQRGRRGRRDGG
jgi:hypothetical protein